MGQGLVIVKLGGSAITQKKKPLTLNRRAISNIARVLESSSLSLALVHGAGSFGHYEAARFGISPDSETKSSEGVSKTRASMAKLNLSIVEILMKHNLYSYPIPPISLYHHGAVKSESKEVLNKIIKMGLIPLTHGDVILGKDGFTVLSGDVIVTDLAKLFRPDRVVFATNVDGIFKLGKTTDKQLLIDELDPKSVSDLIFSQVQGDVTGGMRTKLLEAIRIAKIGIDVYFTNGLDGGKLMKALKGEPHAGTLIRGVKSGN